MLTDHSIMSFINGYTLTDDKNIDTDDEIINWTIVDVIDDISSAIWVRAFIKLLLHVKEEH